MSTAVEAEVEEPVKNTAPSADASGCGGGGDDVEGGNATPCFTIYLPPEPELKGFFKPIPETTFLERVAAGVAGAAVITALAAIIVEQSAIVVIAGILSMTVGPYAYFQQTRITDIKALRATHKIIKDEVDKLQAENNRLAENVADLNTSVQHLEDVQSALDVIKSTKGESIETYAHQVEENTKILKQLKQGESNLTACVLQHLLSILLLSDAHGNFSISESETDDLVRRIQNIPGVKLRESKFRSAIAGQSIPAIMEMVRNLLKADDVPEDKVIFELQSK